MNATIISVPPGESVSVPTGSKDLPEPPVRLPRGFIETYEMTVARLSTIIFLILVSVGFILLTIKIAQDRSISWLIGGCVLAVFATFYITQFLDLAGWSANYNVARMEQDRSRVFDTNTMCRWGPDVWPALRRGLAQSGLLSALPFRLAALARIQPARLLEPLGGGRKAE